jgi:hypothetical protein
MNELNKIIDEKLPNYRPRFKCQEIVMQGQAFEVYFRDIIPCLKALFGDPEFASHLHTAPERHFLDEGFEVRIYHELNTGNWWWSIQVVQNFII